VFGDESRASLRALPPSLGDGNARIAEAAPREVEHVALRGALELCLLYRDDPERYKRAAARWIARLIAERPRIQLSEIELAAAGFREAVHHRRGEVALRRLFDARSLLGGGLEGVDSAGRG